MVDFNVLFAHHSIGTGRDPYLDQRAFPLLWAGQAVSQFGSKVGRSAISFAAIATLGATPFQLAALGAVEHLSEITGAAIATAVTDRTRRRPVMIAADAGRAVVTLAVPVLAFTAGLEFAHLVAVAALVGTLSVIFDVACGAYVPTIVPPERLVVANSRLSAGASVAEVAGFGIAGWLVQWLTAPIAIAVDALTFVVSAISLWLIRTPEPLPVPHPAEGDQGDVSVPGPTGWAARSRAAVRLGISDSRVGFTAIRSHPVLWGQFLAFLCDAVAGGIASVTIVLYMIRVVGFDPGVLTTIWAIGGVTSLGGAFIARRIVARLGAGPTMVLGLVGTGAGTLLITAASAPDLAGAVFLVLNQLVVDPCATIYQITADSLRQAITPNHVLGRVGSATRLATSIFTIAGMGLGGVIVETIGMGAGVAASGIGALLAAAILASGPAGRVGPITVEAD